MNYRAIHSIGGGSDKRITPGTIVEAGKQLTEAECAAHLKSGFLEAMGDTQGGPVYERVDDDPAPTLKELNAMLHSVDPELVCDTVEEAEAMLKQLNSGEQEG